MVHRAGRGRATWGLCISPITLEGQQVFKARENYKQPHQKFKRILLKKSLLLDEDYHQEITILKTEKNKKKIIRSELKLNHSQQTNRDPF